ncbi:xanthine dehydrogenase small subunit [Hahella sp. HN01]|uniref:xanthine dehydrogenase small subunit n=1 Tax=Hahella sp. HN01 TaxID=2847262 RepID=UPI001C1EC9B1|nr:xanthine dehydrogenase small subunit [Hahella sp. HN01]
MIRFLLNDDALELDNFDPDLTILEFLRTNKGLTGTKEGCASGDCGACTAVIATEENGALAYRSINTCITFLGGLHGKQLITVEYLNRRGALHPVQQAMVDQHGSQCGFCTPGFVMSLYALYQHKQQKADTRACSRQEGEAYLAGNLCRCTGYRPILDAARQATSPEQLAQIKEDEAAICARLAAIKAQGPGSVTREDQGVTKHFHLPTNLDQLAQFYDAAPSARLLAGGTDLALEVTQQLKQLDNIIYVGAVDEMNALTVTEDTLEIGAAVTYERAMSALSQEYPDIEPFLERLGSMQVRNQGTLGGNIGNASPIGDMPPVLLALNAVLTLRKGEQSRRLPLDQFFLDYKKTALQPGEFIASISIPRARPDASLHLYKVSKRLEDDISAVCLACYLKIENGSVAEIRLGVGGMAAIPKRAMLTEQAMLQQPWTPDTIQAAQTAIMQEFSPLSDVRASADYRRKVAANLLQRLYIESADGAVATRVFHYA